MDCTTCICCAENSSRDYVNPYTGKHEIHIDCWKKHTWHDASEPCEEHTSKGEFGIENYEKKKQYSDDLATFKWSDFD